LRGIQTIKTIGVAAMARNSYEDRYIDIANASFKVARYSELANILTHLITALASIAILFIGASYVMSGELSIGGLLAFNMLTAALFSPVDELASAWTAFLETLNAVERLGDIMEKTPELLPYSFETEKIKAPRLRGGIEFSSVTFRYNPEDENNILQNVNFNILPGEKVALVGPSGCGKSTIIKLLHRSYLPSAGHIIYDGFEGDDVWIQSLRENIGMVVQDPMIFAGTVRENITIVKPDASSDAVIEAAKLAEAHEFIIGMIGGYDAKLTERGRNLSGGQRQRIALARAFLLNPPILVLDEATSALDNETERRVIESIFHKFNGRTVIMIAHRLSTIRRCEKIIVLNRGMVVETGNHLELIEKKGLYYHLNSVSH